MAVHRDMCTESTKGQKEGLAWWKMKMNDEVSVSTIKIWYCLRHQLSSKRVTPTDNNAYPCS